MIEFPRFVNFVAILAIYPVFPSIVWAHTDSCNGEKLLLQRFDELQKRMDKIDVEIKWLLREQGDCERDLEMMRCDLDHVCIVH